jgi:hypothetical protein
MVAVHTVCIQGISGSYAALFNSTAMSFDLALFFVTDEPAVLEELNIKVRHDACITLWPVALAVA